MIITTSPTVEDKQVGEYLGIVAGETIMGANIFRDFLAGIRDVIGGRSGAYEKALQEGREIALREMQTKAETLGADAVIAVDIDYETLGQGGSMLMVTASGTAVKLK